MSFSVTVLIISIKPEELLENPDRLMDWGRVAVVKYQKYRCTTIDTRVDSGWGTKVLTCVTTGWGGGELGVGTLSFTEWVPVYVRPDISDSGQDKGRITGKVRRVGTTGY